MKNRRKIKDLAFWGNKSGGAIADSLYHEAPTLAPYHPTGTYNELLQHQVTLNEDGNGGFTLIGSGRWSRKAKEVMRQLNFRPCDKVSNQYLVANGEGISIDADYVLLRWEIHTHVEAVPDDNGGHLMKQVFTDHLYWANEQLNPEAQIYKTSWRWIHS